MRVERAGQMEQVRTRDAELTTCPESSRVAKESRDASRHGFTGLSRLSRVVPTLKQRTTQMVEVPA